MELYGKSNLSKLDYQYFKLKLLLSLEIGSYSNEDTLRNNIYYKLFPYRQELKDTISAFGGSISIFEFRNCLRNFEEIISDQEIEYLIYRMKWSNRSLRIYNLNSKPFIELLYDDTLIGYPQENSKISPKHSRQDSDINRIIALCEESDCEMTSKKIIYSLKKHLDDGEKEKEFEEFLSNFSFAMKINGKRHITLSLRSLVNFFEKKSILLPNSKELKCFLTAFFVSDKDKAKELLLQLELIDVNKLKSSLLGCNLNPQCSCDSQCSLDTFAELFYGMLHSKSISYEEFIFLSQISIHLAQTRKYFIFDDFVKIITIDWNNDFCCNGLKSSNICFSLIHEGVDCKAVDLEKFKGLLVDLGYCKGENESCNQINNIEANPNKNKEDGIDDDKPETNQGDHIEDEEVLDVNQRDIIHNEQDPAINPLDQNDFKFEGVEFVNNIVRDSLKRYSVDLEKQAKTLSASLCKELLDKATSNFKEEIDEEFINEVLIIGSEMEERANNSCGNERKAPNFANQYDETDNDQGDYTLNDRNALKKAKLPDNTTANPQSDCLKGVNQLRSLSVEDVMQVEVNQEKGLLSIRFKDEDLLKFDNESQCQHLNERASSRFGNISSRSKKETAKVDLASAQKYKRVQTLKGYVPKLNGLD